jgi:hypothetical protein
MRFEDWATKQPLRFTRRAGEPAFGGAIGEQGDKKIFCRLVKNVQMQGARSPEE